MRKNLRGLEILGIPLDKSLGIIDWAIWYFICEKESEGCKAICSSKPRCEIGRLRIWVTMQNYVNVFKNR